MRKMRKFMDDGCGDACTFSCLSVVSLRRHCSTGTWLFRQARNTHTQYPHHFWYTLNAYFCAVYRNINGYDVVAPRRSLSALTVSRAACTQTPRTVASSTGKRCTRRTTQLMYTIHSHQAKHQAHVFIIPCFEFWFVYYFIFLQCIRRRRCRRRRCCCCIRLDWLDCVNSADQFPRHIVVERV